MHQHALPISRPVLSSLVNSKANLSGEMALRIEKAFGVKLETPMGLQSAFGFARMRSLVVYEGAPHA
jgi:plasmid maintenance system antidote protein VapI